jgi:tetratricopeptide (TPR) repeat protein
MHRQPLNAAAARRRLLLALPLLLLTLALPPTLRAQAGEDVGALKQKAAQLVEQKKYTEALPLLEKIAAAEPDDAQTQFYLGFALIGQANNTKDAAARKALRLRSRAAFVKSKELGFKEPIVDALIQSLPPDGSDGAAFSQNAEANKLTGEAEAFFSRGQLDDALRNYQAALRLDPKLYMAALFSGDVYKERGDFQQAETWYQKAIEIDPTRETAYRYSATPLMKQGKYD